MLGITFRGVHSNDLGVIWKTSKRPIMPMPKSYVENLPEKDGGIDFSAINADNRYHYEDRVFEGTLSLNALNIKDLQTKMTRVARWLFGGYADLIFDDMPCTVWTARIENIDQAGYELCKIGSATIYFRVKPFSRSIFSSTGNITLEQTIPLDSEIPIDWSTEDYIFNFGANTQKNIVNLGDWYTRPIFNITGNFDNVTIISGDKFISYTGGCTNGETVIINFETQMITKNGANKSLYSSGLPWEFPPGINGLTIISSGIGTISVDMVFNFINEAVFDGA